MEKKGIAAWRIQIKHYPKLARQYLLTGDEKYLSIRQFSDSKKREAYERQNGICPICKQHFEIEQMEGDHIDPWHSGGKTDAANCQMLCKPCNRRKSGK
ncbi:MAG: HNH endonuclease [Oscillospiraceae bacterium]|nr:HNH endonuclease [Oscillospiraceae bacterium]